MCTGGLYLNEGGRRCRPVFVQNALGQVFAQILEEGVAYVIQEILILRAVFLMTVDEAFYKPEKKTDTRKEIYYTCKMQSQKYTQKQTVTKYQSSTCVLTQQPVDAS